MPPKKKLNIVAWATIIISIVSMLVTAGIAYGNIRTRVDDLKIDVDTVKTETVAIKNDTNKEIKEMSKTIQVQQIQLTRTNTMLEMLLIKEGIAPPANTSTDTIPIN